MKISFPKAMFSRKWIALMVIIFIIASSIAGYIYIQNNMIIQPLTVGEKVPFVVVQTLDGKDVSTRSPLMKKSVVIFFSTSCSHCEDVIKNIRLLFPIIKDSLNIVAISIDNREETEKFIRNHDVSFPIYLDIDYKAGKVFHVYPIPVLFFINQDQRLIKFKAGEQSKEQLRAMLLSFAYKTSDSTFTKL
jgi:peroxiredoxin